MSDAEENLVGYFQQLLFIIYFIAFTIFNLWYSYPAWLLLVFHATYGMMWAHKSSIGYVASTHLDIASTNNEFFLASIMIYVHWLFPFLPLTLIGIYNVHLSFVGMIFAWLLFVWGIFYQFVSDIHLTLFFFHRNELIRIKNLLPEEYSSLISIPQPPQGHLWSITRHPNYFGEFLIFVAFTICSSSFIPLILLAIIIIFFWRPSIIKLEQELPKTPENEEYMKSTAEIFPLLY